MIKSEVINHEGNPGPNWLDHCRTVFTPWTATLLLIIIAAAVTVIDVTKKDTATTANTTPTNGATSQLPSYDDSAESLKVTPVAPSADDAASSALQSVPTTTQPTTSAASTLGPAPVTQTGTSPSSALTQNQLNARSLTDTVQSTVNNAQSVVNTTLKGVTKGLGL